MLKITILKPMEKDQTYWFLTVKDAIVFLNHEAGIEPTRAAELKRAPVQSEQPCPECKGAKLVRFIDGFGQCPICEGTGRAKRSDGG